MKNDYLVWVDCEMTGLNPKIDALIEVAVIVTDSQLKILDPGLDIIIKTEANKLANMEDIVAKMHAASGLTASVLEAQTTLAQAQTKILNYVKQFVPQANTALLAGNSIGVDRLFIAEYLPEFNNFLHYRVIDVSSIKELCLRWYPKIYYSKPEKTLAHRALSDITESIAELQFYRENIFIPPSRLTSDRVTKYNMNS